MFRKVIEYYIVWPTGAAEQHTEYVYCHIIQILLRVGSYLGKRGPTALKRAEMFSRVVKAEFIELHEMLVRASQEVHDHSGITVNPVLILVPHQV